MSAAGLPVRFSENNNPGFLKNRFGDEPVFWLVFNKPVS